VGTGIDFQLKMDVEGVPSSEEAAGTASLRGCQRELKSPEPGLNTGDLAFLPEGACEDSSGLNTALSTGRGAQGVDFCSTQLGLPRRWRLGSIDDFTAGKGNC
jgi:hypothetical protein